MTNSSLAVLYGEGTGLIPCAGLCFVDDNCVELLYGEISRHCIGLHCVNKGSYSYQYVVPESAQMLHYEKGKMSCLIEKKNIQTIF